MAAFVNQADLSAAINTTIRTVTTGKENSYSVNFCNRNSNAVTVRLAMSCASATPANSEWTFYDVIIPENGSLERTGLIATSAKLIVAYSSHANVSVQVYGYED